MHALAFCRRMAFPLSGGSQRTVLPSTGLRPRHGLGLGLTLCLLTSMATHPGWTQPATHADAATEPPIRLIHASPLPQPAAGPSDQDIAQRLSALMQQADRAATLHGAARSATESRSAAQAAWALGLIHLHGAGVPQNRMQAQRWFMQAAAGGFPLAQAGLAWCAMDGCSGPPDLEAADAAIAALRPSAPARAAFLAWLVEGRRARNLPSQQLAPGRSPLLLAAAQGGEVHALNALGIDAALHGQDAVAEGYFRRAAPGSPAARANLERLTRRPSVRDSTVSRPAPTSPTSGEAHASADALYQKARALHRGIGRTPNYSEALRLYAKAASRGSVAAQRMLQLIYARPAPQGGVDILWMQQLAQVDPGVVPSSAIVPDGVQIWQREPTPLYDLLPTFWQQLVGEVSRGG